MTNEQFDECSEFIKQKGCLTCMTLINMICQQQVATLKAFNTFYKIALFNTL